MIQVPQSKDTIRSGSDFSKDWNPKMNEVTEGEDGKEGQERKRKESKLK